MNKYFSLIAIIFLFLNSCTSKEDKPVATTPDKIDLQKIEFTRLSKQLITKVVECTGIIDVPPNQRAALYAPIGGNIGDIRVLPGDRVKKGQILYSLRHQDIVKVQEQYLVAHSDEQLQKVNLEKKQQLFESNNISQREFRQAEHDYAVAKANLASLAAQLQIIGVSGPGLLQHGVRPSISVRAPISGYISKIEAVSGSYLNMNSRIMTIVAADHMHLELEVYADRITEVNPGQKVGFRVTGDDTEHWGEVYLVGKEVDQETRTVAVHAHIQDEDAMVVGSYLYAGILVSADSLWSVPMTAVVNADSKNFVVVREGEGLQSIEVEVGNSFKDYIAISNYTDLMNKDIIAKDAYYYFEE